MTDRYEIFLRQGSDGSLRCRRGRPDQSDDPGQWADTGLRPDTQYDGDNAETLSQLFSELSSITDIREVERKLTYRRQEGIGLDLHRALFPDGQNLNGVPWIHIVPYWAGKDDAAGRSQRDDFLDFTLRIPWAFLTSELSEGARFLVLGEANPTAITIDAAPGPKGRPRFEHIRLPPCPRVLLICPTADPEIKGEQHGEELRDILLKDYEKSLADNVRLVTRFSEFEHHIRHFTPHIIYFYGHAKSREKETIIEFDREDEGDPYQGTRSIDDVRRALDRQIRGVPPVIWINACQGASAARNNVLRLLAPVAAAVITTRTIAVVDDSLELGRRVLPKIAIDGEAPPVAVRNAIPELGAEAVRSARWATTVVAVQYGSWTALDTEKRNIADIESGADFPIRIDRAAALDAIESQIRQTLETPNRKAHFILWHAPADQAPDIFEQRFTDLVVESFPAYSPIVRRVELQPVARPNGQPAAGAAKAEKTTENLNRFFQDCIYRALESVPATSPVGNVNRSRVDRSLSTLHAGGCRILLLIHGPFDASHKGLLRDYLKFWRELYPDLLDGIDKIRICLGLHFVEGLGFEPPDGQSDVLVEPLGPVPLDELADHIEAFGKFYDIASENAEKEARKLIETSKASFRPIYDCLRKRISFDWYNR